MCSIHNRGQFEARGHHHGQFHHPGFGHFDSRGHNHGFGHFYNRGPFNHHKSGFGPHCHREFNFSGCGGPHHRRGGAFYQSGFCHAEQESRQCRGPQFEQAPFDFMVREQCGRNRSTRANGRDGYQTA